MADATKTLAVELVTNAPTFTAEMAAATAAVKEFATVSGVAGKEVSVSMGVAAKETAALTAANRALAVSSKEVQVAATGMGASLKTFSAEAAALARPFTAFSAAGREGVATMDKMSASSAGLIGGLSGSATAAGLAAAGFAVLGVEGVKNFLKLAEEARGVQRVTLATAEDSSRLAGVSRLLGVDVDKLDISMARLAKNVGSQPQLLQSWNIELAHTKDGHVDLYTTLANVSERYQQLGNITDKARLANELFGRGFKDLIPLLNLSKEEYTQFAQSLKDHGEIFSQNDLNTAREFGIQTRELKSSVEGLTVSIGRGLVPVLIELAKDLETVVGWIKTAAERYGDFTDKINATTSGQGAKGPLAQLNQVLKDAFTNQGDIERHTRAMDANGKAAHDAAAAQEDLAGKTKTSAEMQQEWVEAVIAGGPAAAAAHDQLVAMTKEQQQQADVMRIIKDEANGNRQALKEEADARKDAAEITKLQTDETRKLADLQERAADNTRALARADQEVTRSRAGLAEANRKLNDLYSFGLADEQAKLEIAAARSTMDHTKAVQSLADAEQKLADLQSFGLQQEHERNVRALESARRDYTSATQAAADAEQKLNDLQSFGLAEEAARNDIAATRTRMDLAKATRDEADAQRALNDLQSGGLADVIQKAQDQAVRTANDLARAKRDEISAQQALNEVTAKYADALERADIAAERGRMRLEDAQSRLEDLQAHLRDLQDPNTSIALDDEERQKEILKTQRDIRSAQLDIRDATLTAKDSEAALNEERTNGLANATTDAENKLADARMRVFDATIASRDAQRALIEEGANGARTLEDAQLRVAEAQLRVREATLASTDAQRALSQEGVTGQEEVRAATDAVSQAKDRAKQALEAEADATRTLSREQQTQAAEMKAAQSAIDEAQLKVTESAIAERTAQRDLNTAWQEGGKLAELVKQGTDAVTTAQDQLNTAIDTVNKTQRESGTIAQEVADVQTQAAQQVQAVYDRMAERQASSIAQLKKDLADMQAAYQSVIAGFATGTAAAAGQNGPGGGYGAASQYYNPGNQGGPQVGGGPSPGESSYSPSSGTYGDTSGFASDPHGTTGTYDPAAWQAAGWHASGGTIGAGFVTNGPQAVVGEGNRAFPEFVIPTDPRYSDNATSLWMQSGRKLGMLAAGGSLGDIPNPAGIAPGDKDLYHQLVAVMEASLWKAATDSIKVKRDQMAAATKAHNITRTTFDTSATPSLFGGSSAGASSAVPAGSVKDWLTEAMGLTGEPSSSLGDLYIIAMGESGGDPHAINNWDSNAKAGHPSKGLMQMVDFANGDGFRQFAVTGHTDIWNPVDNAASAIGLIHHDYGSVANVPGVKAVHAGKPYVGYEEGGVLGDLHMGVMDRGGFLLPGWNLNFVGTGQAERVLGPGQGGGVVFTRPLVEITQHIAGGTDPEVFRKVTKEAVEPVVSRAFADFRQDLAQHSPVH